MVFKRHRIRSTSYLALWFGKLVYFLLRVAGKQGTSLPGWLLWRIRPSLLQELLQQLDQCVLVTGTNGKTTTTALIHAMLDNAKDPWITNRGGANLIQGVLAALLQHVSMSGRLLAKNAVLEVDEATFPHVMTRVSPTLLVVTNILRDQLDRYGEVDQALTLIRQGILLHPESQVIVNADDPLSASLGIDRELTYFYGMSVTPHHDPNRVEVRDGAFCLRCGHELQYEGFIYGQMGYYACPSCGFARPTPHFTGVHDDVKKNLQVTETMHQAESEVYSFYAPMFGIYNWYNLLSAIAVVRVLGSSPRILQDRLKNYEAPTGRMQTFLGSPQKILTLIKNPTGANSVLRAIESDAEQKSICFTINDDDADGRDVSWLWDIDLESFVTHTICQTYYCAGTRALDMALRLTYAGIRRDQVEVIDSLEKIDLVTKKAQGKVYILSTYTALYKLAAQFHEAQRSKAVQRS